MYHSATDGLDWSCLLFSHADQRCRDWAVLLVYYLCCYSLITRIKLNTAIDWILTRADKVASSFTFVFTSVDIIFLVRLLDYGIIFHRYVCVSILCQTVLPCCFTRASSLDTRTVQVRVCQDYRCRNYWLTDQNGRERIMLARVGHHRVEGVESMKAESSLPIYIHLDRGIHSGKEIGRRLDACELDQSRIDMLGERVYQSSISFVFFLSLHGQKKIARGNTSSLLTGTVLTVVWLRFST